MNSMMTFLTEMEHLNQMRTNKLYGLIIRAVETKLQQMHLHDSVHANALVLECASVLCICLVPKSIKRTINTKGTPSYKGSLTQHHCHAHTSIKIPSVIANRHAVLQMLPVRHVCFVADNPKRR